MLLQRSGIYIEPSNAEKSSPSIHINIDYFDETARKLNEIS
jgi:hypothetical protein